jgi:ElaB/YqjD/DUF883 family membrane-anchored ribosome-binding protein
MEATTKANGPQGSDLSKSSLDQAAARASAAAHNTVDKVADAARPALDRLASGAHATVDKLAGAASSAAEVLGEKGEQLKLSQERLLENTTSYIRANPVTSLGIAVLAGFVLSRLLSQR